MQKQKVGECLQSRAALFALWHIIHNRIKYLNTHIFQLNKILRHISLNEKTRYTHGLSGCALLCFSSSVTISSALETDLQRRSRRCLSIISLFPIEFTLGMESSCPVPSESDGLLFIFDFIVYSPLFTIF